MEVKKCIILENKEIAKDTYRLVFEFGQTDNIGAGQFFNIGIADNFLRRPISVAEVIDDKVVIIYKVVGEGTEKLSKMSQGELLDVMGSLGTSYPIEDLEKVLLIGGGVGVPPMIELAKRYRANGSKVTAILGFKDNDSVFGVENLKEIGCDVLVATDDGSNGFKGNVIELYDSIEDKEALGDYVCACGPKVMLKAVEDRFLKGYVSFESRMACGMGVCMACVVEDKEEKELYHRICKEGAVFQIGRLKY